MATQDRAIRSRRSLLRAALGAGAATVAGALVRPELVRAGSDGDVVLGGVNLASSTTLITQETTAGPALRAGSLNGVGVQGESQTGPGVLGISELGENQPGVRGIGYQQSPGVVGWCQAGYADTAGPTEFPTMTGVYGATTVELNPNERGVYGKATQGQGVRGEATNGIGVYATATTGTALWVNGKAVFSRSGRATVASGHSYVDVTVTGGLAGTPLCFANLMTYRSGVSVAAVRPNYPSTGKVRIYLNKAVTASTYVAWMVMG